MIDDNQVTELTELTDLITSSNGARILKRDNVLIKAVYNATALETKIFLRALYDAQQTSRFEFNYGKPQNSVENRFCNKTPKINCAFSG